VSRNPKVDLLWRHFAGGLHEGIEQGMCYKQSSKWKRFGDIIVDG